MRVQAHNWHLEIAKPFPEVLHSVGANQGRNEEANPFDAANATYGKARHTEPKPPIDRERPEVRAKESVVYQEENDEFDALPLLIVEFRETEDRGECETN